MAVCVCVCVCVCVTDVQARQTLFNEYSNLLAVGTDRHLDEVNSCQVSVCLSQAGILSADTSTGYWRLLIHS